MKLIPLSQGKFAQVDDADFEFLNQWKWYARKDKHAFYINRNERDKLTGKRYSILMARIIMDVTDSKIFVDHRDRNGLNNQRENLRASTNQQNSCNRIAKNNSSKYKGVTLNKASNKFKVQITSPDRRRIYLGSFKSEIEAAETYNKAALKYHGEFAFLNDTPNKKYLKS